MMDDAVVPDHTVSVQEEVLMMLDNYVRDFKALIDWIQLQEKLENTDAQNRPTSLAWEVRKMSPGRHVMPNPSADRMVTSPGARRALNFNGPPPTLAAARLSHPGPSWADRVKCSQTVTNSNQPTASVVEKIGKKDAEGWETVHRGRTAKPRSATLPGKACSELVQAAPKRERPKCEQPHAPPQEEQLSHAQCPVTEDTTIQDDEQQVLAEPDPPEKVGCQENGDMMEPPAESVQDSGRCIDAPCGDAPPHIAAPTPSQAPDPTLSSATHPPADIILSVPAMVRSTSPDLSQTDGSGALALGGSGAEGGASQGKATSAPGLTETPMAAVKLESVLDPTELSTPQSMAEVLAKKEELADRLEKANEEAIASAIAEEEQLTREIQAENNDLETDNDFSSAIGNGSCGASVDWSDMLADYDAHESWRQNTSWGDMVEEEPSRPPGHGIHMHEKLSSPSRKRTIAESKKKHEEKQLKAQQLRDKLREEKTLKLQKLLEREKEVRKWKEELLEQRRRMMDEKLLHAEFKRELQLQAIVKKAQEEEAKVNEIAFINTLEAQNKRHDALAKLNEYEQRLNELQEDRQRRQEEKQARDEAVQERKRVLEAERQARVEELLMRRKEQEARIEQQRQEKEKAREDAARERARSPQRCTCLATPRAKDINRLSETVAASRDESCPMKKWAKEYETSVETKAQVPDSPYKAKLQRLVKDLLKHLQGQDSGQWANNKVSSLDRTLGELSRILEKQATEKEVKGRKNNADQVAFQMGGGLSALEQILQVVTVASTPTAVPRIPLKSLSAAVNTYYLACSCCPINSSYVLLTNKIALLMDILLHQLTHRRDKVQAQNCGTGMNSTGAPLVLSSNLEQSYVLRAHWESYVVNMGLIDKLYGCFLSVQGPVDEHPKMSAFLQQASALLHSMCKLCYVVTGRAPNIFDNKHQDSTGLSALLQSTDLVGVVHTLYCILLHGFLPEMASPRQELYDPGVIRVALQGIRFLNSFALLDLSAFQCVLGAEGLSLAFRHIISSLLWYCSQHSSEEVLHEVIICVGYFTVNNPDNQFYDVRLPVGDVQREEMRRPGLDHCSSPGRGSFGTSRPSPLPGDRAVWPPAQRPAETLSAALPVLQPPAPDQGAVPLPHLSLLQQRAQQGDPAAGDELRAAGDLHPGLCCKRERVRQQNKAHGIKSFSLLCKVSHLLDYCELSNRFPRDQWDAALKFFLKKHED
ncbi:unnamed protein product, partial [Tetraodon nigroviridis]